MQLWILDYVLLDRHEKERLTDVETSVKNCGGFRMKGNDV